MALALALACRPSCSSCLASRISCRTRVVASSASPFSSSAVDGCSEGAAPAGCVVARAPEGGSWIAKAVPPYRRVVGIVGQASPAPDLATQPPRELSHITGDPAVAGRRPAGPPAGPPPPWWSGSVGAG